MNTDFIKPPVTNRGVETPIGTDLPEIYMLFDWIQCTIFTENNVYKLFRDLFGIYYEDISEEDKGIYFYTKTYSYKHIKILENISRSDMGIHILLSGSGCRDLEDLGINYYFFFKKLASYGAKFTRIDISIDTFTSKYFDIVRINDCIVNNEVVSKFKNVVNFVKTNLGNSKNEGATLWFGSRSSDIQIVFYDKLKERKSNHVLVSDKIKFWNRLECRFRNNHADTMVHNFINSDDFVKYYLGVVNNYISFCEYNPNDLKHRYRWNLKPWWRDFVNNSNKIKLSNVNHEKSITSVQRWLDKSVSKSLFMLYLANYKNSETSFDNYISTLKKGNSKLRHSDIAFINEHRLSLGLDPLDEFIIVDILNLF